MSGEADRLNRPQSPFDHPLKSQLPRQSSWDDAEVVQPSDLNLKTGNVPIGVIQNKDSRGAAGMGALHSITSHNDSHYALEHKEQMDNDLNADADEEFCDPAPEDTSLSLWSKSVRGMKLFIMQKTGLFREHRFKEDEPAFLLGRKYFAKIPNAPHTLELPQALRCASSGERGNPQSQNLNSSKSIHAQNAKRLREATPTAQIIIGPSKEEEKPLAIGHGVVLERMSSNDAIILSPTECKSSPKLPPGTFKQFRETFDALIWVTYRKNFPPIKPPRSLTKHSSDAGWGCMLRSAQMLLANTLMIHCLSRRWADFVPSCPIVPEDEIAQTGEGVENQQQRTPSNENGKCASRSDSIAKRPKYPPEEYGKVLQLFIDHPKAPLSIHLLTSFGSQLYNRHAGEWYGPAQAAHLLNSCVKLIPQEVISNFCIVPMQGNTAYLDQIEQACRTADKVNLPRTTNIEAKDESNGQEKPTQFELNSKQQLQRQNDRKERRFKSRPTNAQTSDDSPLTLDINDLLSSDAKNTNSENLRKGLAQKALLGMIADKEDDKISNELFPEDSKRDRLKELLPSKENLLLLEDNTDEGSKVASSPTLTRRSSRLVLSDVSMNAVDENEDEVDERSKLDVVAFCTLETKSDEEQQDAWKTPLSVKHISESGRSASYFNAKKTKVKAPTYMLSGEESDLEDSAPDDEIDDMVHSKSLDTKDMISAIKPIIDGEKTDVNSKSENVGLKLNEVKPTSVNDSKGSDVQNGKLEHQHQQQEQQQQKQKQEEVENWRSCLILIPIRAGVSDVIEPKYYSSILHLLQFPMSVGIMGGKPKSSLYFVGAQGTRLFYLDPHTTQECVVGDIATSRGLVQSTTCGNPKHHHTVPVGQTYKDDEASGLLRKPRGGDSYRHAPIQSIDLGAVDASMTAAFYCRTKADVQAFWRLLKKVEAEPFTVISGCEKTPSLDDFECLSFDDEHDEEINDEVLVETTRTGKVRPSNNFRNNETSAKQIASYAPVIPEHNADKNVKKNEMARVSLEEKPPIQDDYPHDYPTDESDENSVVSSRYSSNERQGHVNGVDQRIVSEASFEIPDSKDIGALSSEDTISDLIPGMPQLIKHSESDQSFVRLSSNLALLQSMNVAETLKPVHTQPMRNSQCRSTYALEDEAFEQVSYFSGRRESEVTAGQKQIDKEESDDDDFVLISSKSQK